MNAGQSRQLMEAGAAGSEAGKTAFEAQMKVLTHAQLCDGAYIAGLIVRAVDGFAAERPRLIAEGWNNEAVDRWIAAAVDVYGREMRQQRHMALAANPPKNVLPPAT